MKILQICFRIPYPPHDGGAIAMYNITKGLKEQGHDLTVLAFNTPKHFQESNVLDHLAKIKAVFVNTEVSLWKALVNFFFKSIPYNIERFIAADFEKALADILTKEKFDIIHFEGTYIAWYVDVVRKYTSAPVVLRTHNCEYLIWERLAANENNFLRKFYFKNLSRRLKKFEQEYYRKVDGIAVISGEDKKFVEHCAPGAKISVIPVGIETGNAATVNITPEAWTILYIGALEWQPNMEGLKWFLDNVWPKALALNPQLKLHIAGKRTPEEILNLKLPNVQVHGFVEDADLFMKKYDLMIVPLLSGSGMRVKILDGMKSGKCILSSLIGAEGIEYENGKNILIADTPQEWVQVISRYFSKGGNNIQLRKNALELVHSKYDNKLIIKKLTDLYKDLLS
ncbi:MAG: glycosyltransferase family 4 protein [Cytophagaceae bacterium]|nr:glycosyltransferase family 4 protein [Cytophagaceae bacterium]